MKNNWTRKLCMMLVISACILLPACQTAEKPKDNKEPVKKEESKKTEDEAKDLPMEAEETDMEGEDVASEEGSVSEPEEKDTNASELPEETNPDAEEE